MKKNFGILPSGEQASLYTISCGGITAGISDYGATLVSLLVPDSTGAVAGSSLHGSSLCCHGTGCYEGGI